MSDTGNDKPAAPSIKALLSAISAEIGPDNPELVKQAFEDTNALQRQQQRNHFDSRVE
jgi:hypothetical protein